MRRQTISQTNHYRVSKSAIKVITARAGECELDREQIVRTTVPEAGAIKHRHCNYVNDISGTNDDSVVDLFIPCSLHAYTVHQKRIRTF